MSSESAGMRSWGLVGAGFLGGALALFFVQSALAPEPLSPVERTDANSPAQAAWEHLIVEMQRSLDVVYGQEAGSEELDRAEGVRFLAHTLAASLDLYADAGATTDPRLIVWRSPQRKLIGDNPDVDYHVAALDGRYGYRLMATPGSPAHLGITVYERRSNGGNRVLADLSGDAIEWDEEGGFSLVLSAYRPDDVVNWIELTDDVHFLIIRQSFRERGLEPAVGFDLRLFESEPVRELSEVEMADRLRQATRFFSEMVERVSTLAAMISERPNLSGPLPGFDERQSGIFPPAQGDQYLRGWYRVAKGEALLVDGYAPDALHWRAVLQNRWMQSLETEAGPVALNDRELRVEADGSYRLVIAHRDPGHQNWLNAAGHEQGLLAIRFLQASEEAEFPRLRLVSLEEARELARRD